MNGKLIGRKEISLVHVAKAQLSLGDGEYRKMLQDVGVSSSKQLTYAQLDELMAAFKALGFKPSRPLAKGAAALAGCPKEKQPMLAKIGAILGDLGMPLSYGDRVAKRMFGVDRLRWCDCEQTYKVLQALIIYQNQRAEAKAETG